MSVSAAPSEIQQALAKLTPYFWRALGMSMLAGLLVLAPTVYMFEVYDRVAQTGEATRFVQEAKAMKRWFDVYASRLGGPGSDLVVVSIDSLRSFGYVTSYQSLTSDSTVHRRFAT